MRVHRFRLRNFFLVEILALNLKFIHALCPFGILAWCRRLTSLRSLIVFVRFPSTFSGLWLLRLFRLLLRFLRHDCLRVGFQNSPGFCASACFIISTRQSENRRVRRRASGATLALLTPPLMSAGHSGTHDSLSGRWSGATGRALHPQGSDERFQIWFLHFIPLSQASCHNHERVLRFGHFGLTSPALTGQKTSCCSLNQNPTDYPR